MLLTALLFSPHCGMLRNYILIDLARNAPRILLWYSVNFCLAKLIVRQISMAFIEKIIAVTSSSDTGCLSDKSITAVENGQPNICYTNLVK